MKRAWAMKLAKALESGRYSQTTGVLRGGDSKSPVYCCLGVACRLAGLRFKRSGGEWYTDGKSKVLPLSVMELMAFKTNSGVIGSGSNAKELAALNDSGSSFKEIAKVIRENWRNL